VHLSKVFGKELLMDPQKALEERRGSKENQSASLEVVGER
jgi:hypothetical protein